MPTSKGLCGLGVTEDFMEEKRLDPGLEEWAAFGESKENISGRNARELGISMVQQGTVWALA